MDLLKLSNKLILKSSRENYSKKRFPETVCKLIFLPFMSLLTASTVKNSHVLAGVYFIFQETSKTKLQMLSIPNLELSEKIGWVVSELYIPVYH